MSSPMAMAAAQFYLVLSVLGVPFFAIFAVLEKSHNPLLTRNSTNEQISDRVQACSACAVVCFFIAVALGAYVKITLTKQATEKRNRHNDHIEAMRN